MGLLTATILLLILAASQAYPSLRYGNNSTIPTETPQARRDEPGDLKLNQTCSGALMTYTHSHQWLPADLNPTNHSTAAVAGHICRHLGCGDAFEVRQKPFAAARHNTTCVSHCTFEDHGRLSCVSNGTCENVTEIDCGKWEIRLANGSHACEGRVEVFRNGWGTVCDDGWRLEAGGVVCRQMGCGPVRNVTGEGGPFPPGPSPWPIHLDDLSCTGDEEHLWDCRSSQRQPHDCGHKEDAGVVCWALNYTTISPTNHTPTHQSPINVISTGAATRAPPVASSSGLQAAVAGCIILTVALILALASNIILCGRYRRKAAARRIHETHGGSTAVIIRERSEHGESSQNLPLLTVPTAVTEAVIEGPKSPVLIRSVSADDSLTSSCNSEDMNYYTQPIPDSHAPEAPVCPDTLSGGVAREEHQTQNDLKDGEDYENTGEGSHHLNTAPSALETYNQSSSSMAREQGGQWDPFKPATTPKSPIMHRSQSTDSSTSSEDMSYYNQPPSTQMTSPVAAVSPDPVSDGIGRERNESGSGPDADPDGIARERHESGRDSGSGADYENTGIEIHNLLMSENGCSLGEPQNPPTALNPSNSQKAASRSSSTSSEDDYENMPFLKETQQHSEGQHCENNHYNRNDLPASNGDKDASCSSSSEDDDYVNVPARPKAPPKAAPSHPDTREDPADHSSSSDSDYDPVAVSD